MVTPGQTIAPPPSHTLSPIVIGSAASQPARRCSGSIGCVGVRIWTAGAIWHPERRHVEQHAVEVDERARADRDVAAVVAAEGRPDHDAVADVAEQLA
jgi:hypothetical protein